MTFDIRISLVSPNGYTIKDKKFRFSTEVEARDKLDVVMMTLDKSYFETYAEYEKTFDAISKILQGYEYSLTPKGRKIKTAFNQEWVRRGR